MTNTLFTCDRCKSAEHTNEFRLEASNFFQTTFSVYPAGGGGPMMPGGMPGGATNRNETFHICKDCKSAFDASIDAIINPLKA